MLEHVRSTTNDTLTMYTNVKQDNSAELLPFVQLAHNITHNKTLKESSHFLMCGGRVTLLVGVTIGPPSNAAS